MVALAEKFSRESYVPQKRTRQIFRSPKNAYSDFFLQPKNRGPAQNNRVLSAKYLDQELEWYYYGFRYYSPELGRWSSRDPIGEDGGLSVYGFVENAPLGRIDFLGLVWYVDRDSGFQAPAKCCRDTVKALAQKIGLKASDYKAWLVPTDGGGLPSSEIALLGEREFLIPNTVYAYWAGNVGNFGKGWVNWNSSVKHLKDLGFKVSEADHVSGTSLVLQNALQAAAKHKMLHGLYFWGHGWKPYPSDGLTDGTEDVLYYKNTTSKNVSMPGIKLSYKMALGLVYACDSNSGKTALSSQSPGSIWHGYNKTLKPIIPGVWHVKKRISHGDQETK